MTSQSSKRAIIASPIALTMLMGASISSAQVVNESMKVTASDGGLSTNLGTSVDINSGIAAIGAPFHNDGNDSFGSVYLFNSTTGAEIGQLFKNPLTSDYEFGFSVSIDNSSVAVGSPRGFENGVRAGSAYVFDANTGNEIIRVFPATGSNEDDFGFAVALDNNTLVVGSPGEDYNGIDETGAAYVYNATTGALLYELHPAGAIQESQFGISVAIDNGIIAVGAMDSPERRPAPSPHGSGKGYVYLFDAATGDFIIRLTSNGAIDHEQFGYSISIDNNILAVGSPRDQDNGYRSGSVYLFNATNGDYISNIYPDDAYPEQQFGTSVSINDGIVAVGTLLDSDPVNRAGSAYLFQASTGNQIAKLLASDSAQLDYLGTSVAIEDDTVFVGAPGVDDQGAQSGAAYIFSVPNQDCAVDFNDDQSLNFLDVSAFLAAFSSQDPAADINNDLSYNFLDVSEFLSLFSAGCP